MNELVVADKAAEWLRLKALVLDSISSPIRRHVYNLALDEFIAWYTEEPRIGFNQGHRERLEGSPGSQETRPDIDQRPVDRHPEVAVEAADNRTAVPGAGCGHL